METKNTRVFSDEEVQIHGGHDGDSFGHWWWVPSHGLPDVKEDKMLVVLHPCDCGCWTAQSTERAMDLILKSPNPEKFVLIEGDTRYDVFNDRTRWFVVAR